MRCVSAKQEYQAIDGELELTILMPCLNEAETLAACIDKAQDYIARQAIAGEVVIADNGSTDGSRQIAERRGARVVHVSERGYGAALQAGIGAARGRYVIMGDSDDSYDFSQLDDFIKKLRQGYDLVMGNRFQGGIMPGAMPPLHRYLGNPVLTGIGRLFFEPKVGDFHCGLRGFRTDAVKRLNLRSSGMEFASEMVARAALSGLSLTEVPTTLSPDGRSRPPHLRSWRDGWRHLRLLLMYAPRWLFLYPGFFMLSFGLVAMGAVLPGPLLIGSVIFDVHTLVVAMGAVLIGSQVTTFYLLAAKFEVVSGIFPDGVALRAYRRLFTLERAVGAGMTLTILGLTGVIYAVWLWSAAEFRTLDYSWMMRIVVPSVTALTLGIQVTFAGFLSSILDMKIEQSQSG